METDAFQVQPMEMSLLDQIANLPSPPAFPSPTYSRDSLERSFEDTDPSIRSTGDGERSKHSRGSADPDDLIGIRELSSKDDRLLELNAIFRDPHGQSEDDGIPETTLREAFLISYGDIEQIAGTRPDFMRLFRKHLSKLRPERKTTQKVSSRSSLHLSLFLIGWLSREKHVMFDSDCPINEESVIDGDSNETLHAVIERLNMVAKSMLISVKREDSRLTCLKRDDFSRIQNVPNMMDPRPPFSASEEDILVRHPVDPDIVIRPGHQTGWKDQFSESSIRNWSRSQLRAWVNRHVNYNAFYYRFTGGYSRKGCQDVHSD